MQSNPQRQMPASRATGDTDSLRINIPLLRVTSNKLNRPHAVLYLSRMWGEVFVLSGEEFRALLTLSEEFRRRIDELVAQRLGSLTKIGETEDKPKE